MKYFLLRRSLVAISLVWGLLAPAMVGVTMAQDGPACNNFGTTSFDSFNGPINPVFVNDVYAVDKAVYNTAYNIVYVATGRGLRIFEGGSYTPRTTANGLGSDLVYGVYAVSGPGSATVYAATGGGLSISSDGGNSFSNKTTANGLGNNEVFNVYAVGSTVYAATADGLSISTDGGNSFSNKTTANGLGGNYVFGVYAVGSTVYVATYGGGLSISTDGGNNFTTKTEANGLSKYVADVYVVGSTVYAATLGGLSISTDGGNSFTNKTTANGLTDNNVKGVFAVGNTVYASPNLGGLDISTDGGQTFTPRNAISNRVGNIYPKGIYVVGGAIYVAKDRGLSIADCSGPTSNLALRTFVATPSVIPLTGTTRLYADVSGGAQPYRYTFSGPGTITPTGNTATVSGLSAGVQTFTVTVTDVSWPTTQTVSGTVSVTVNPNLNPVNLSVSSHTASEASPTAITVTATASAPVVGDQTVDLSVTGGDINSSDYILSGTTITIPNGQTAGSVTFTVVDDNEVEYTEIAELTIRTPSSNIVLGNITTQNITITDNDVGPDLSVSDASMKEGSTGQTTFTFTVNLSAPAPVGGVIFHIDTRSEYTQENTAEPGHDYISQDLAGQTIPEGSSTYSFDVLVNGDTEFEPDETFFVYVRDVGGAVVVKESGTGTILNDDDPSVDLNIGLAAPVSATLDQPYTYTLVVANIGTTDARNVDVEFTLPPNLTYETATGVGFSVSESNGIVRFGNRVIPIPGNSQTILTVTVTPTAVGSISAPVCAAFVDPDNTIAELNEDNNGSPTVVTTTVVRGKGHPGNARPVATPNDNQTATVGTAFAYTVNAFTDAQTPNALTYSADIEPANGLVFDPATRIISGTPSEKGVSRVQVKATDPDGRWARTSFSIRVKPVPETFAITGVTTVSCKSLSTKQWEVSFTPQYTGLSGQPVSFSVANELAPTTAAGPYSLTLNVGKPAITLKATQQGTTKKATFSYAWLGACTGGGRLGAESESVLAVRVLGNPARNGQVSIEVRGAAGEPLRIDLTDLRGQVIGSHSMERAGSVEEHTFEIGRQAGGVLLLRATTPTQSQTVKVLRAD